MWAASMVLVVAVTVLGGRTYSSTAAFVPQSSEGGLSQLSGLAAQFGITAPQPDASASLAFYVSLLKSRDVLRRQRARATRPSAGALDLPRRRPGVLRGGDVVSRAAARDRGGRFPLRVRGDPGRNYDLELLVRTARAVQADHPGTCLVCLGAGELEPALRSLGAEIGLRSWFSGLLPHRDLVALLGRMDYGLNTFRGRRHVACSYKLNDYLLAGIPVINSLPGETWEMVEANDLGIQLRRRQRRGTGACDAPCSRRSREGGTLCDGIRRCLPRPNPHLRADRGRAAALRRRAGGLHVAVESLVQQHAQVVQQSRDPARRPDAHGAHLPETLER